jgi:hypothetical protein
LVKAAKVTTGKQLAPRDYAGAAAALVSHAQTLNKGI